MVGAGGETSGAATLSSEVREHEAVLLLQSSRVLEHATTLMTLYEALDARRPVLCVLLKQSNYDFARSKAMLAQQKVAEDRAKTAAEAKAKERARDFAAGQADA